MNSNTGEQNPATLSSWESAFYTEFGVILISDMMAPALVNEVILRQHAIIEADDAVDSNQSFLTPGLSQLQFENGLSIAATPDRVQFLQRGEFADPEVNRCPIVATNFIRSLFSNPCSSVGINFSMVLPQKQNSAGQATRTTRFFNQPEVWSALRGNHPEMHFRTVYKSEERTLTVQVGPVIKDGDQSAVGEVYSANFHRVLASNDEEESRARLNEILRNWQLDLEEFKELATNLENVEP